MVDDIVVVVGMLAAGACLGLLFCGGLWLTLQRLPASRHPYLLTLGSLVLRTVLVLGGVWLCANGRPWRIAVVMAGFVVVQLLTTARAAYGPDSVEKKSVP